MAYPEEVEALLASLHNPRYATQDPPHIAPIRFDGMLLDDNVVFVAHPDDSVDYGVVTWEKAQRGEMGPIAPYLPPPPDPPPIYIGPSDAIIGAASAWGLGPEQAVMFMLATDKLRVTLAAAQAALLSKGGDEAARLEYEAVVKAAVAEYNAVSPKPLTFSGA